MTFPAISMPLWFRMILLADEMVESIMKARDSVIDDSVPDFQLFRKVW
jgi:hypothetical protein